MWLSVDDMSISAALHLQTWAKHAAAAMATAHWVHTLRKIS